MELNRREMLLAVAGLPALSLIPRNDTPPEPPPVPPQPGPAFRTGFRSLDFALADGGLMPGELTVVIGGRGAGKTSFVDTIARTNAATSSHYRGQCEEGNNDLLCLRHKVQSQFFYDFNFMTMFGDPTDEAYKSRCWMSLAQELRALAEKNHSSYVVSINLEWDKEREEFKTYPAHAVKFWAHNVIYITKSRKGIHSNVRLVKCVSPSPRLSEVMLGCNFPVSFDIFAGCHEDWHWRRQQG